jgi:hypothetical protein
VAIPIAECSSIGTLLGIDICYNCWARVSSAFLDRVSIPVYSFLMLSKMHHVKAFFGQCFDSCIFTSYAKL